MTDRSPATNPFTPGYGAVPEVWAGRAEEFADFHEVLLPRVTAGIYEQARLVTGDRGVGKTAFLKTLADEAEDADNWPVYVAARRGDGLVDDLVRALSATLDARNMVHRLTESARALLRAVGSVRVGAAGGGAAISARAQPVRAMDLSGLLREAGALARARDAALVLMVDEAQNADRPALGELCHALQDAQTHAERVQDPTGARVRRHLPLGVYVAGLPDLAGRIQETGATFFERSRHLDFGLLRDPDVRAALVAFAGNRDVGIDADALDALVAAVGGYPYFLHLYGARVWTAGTGPVIARADVEAGVASAADDVDRFYEERLRTLGRVQEAWLAAAAQLRDDELRVAAVAEALGRRSSDLGTTVTSLAERGLIRQLGRGRVRFALPGLARHLRGRG